jgi:hypothetical protein
MNAAGILNIKRFEFFLNATAEAAVSHVGSGGFSNRSSPFIVGMSQFPFDSISRAVMKFLDSIMFGSSTDRFAKKVMAQTNIRTR